jgi:2-oxo-4-hydroxy-4-carboxy-5-ureidoimidazoline decarboxylase
MNQVLAQWNAAETQSAMQVMMDCCGAHRWAREMVDQRPIPTESGLHEAADRIWDKMMESDWMEAFSHHPRIGERKAQKASSQSSAWSSQEQSSIKTAADSVLTALTHGNARYEDKFGFTYIVCATGKTPEAMLAILRRRLTNARAAELREAAEQQRQILHIRLRKSFGQ